MISVADAARAVIDAARPDPDDGDLALVPAALLDALLDAIGGAQ